MKQHPKFLKEGYEVEWCHHMAICDDGSLDPDRCEYSRKHFATKEEAIDYAKEKAKVDPFGSVRVCEFFLQLKAEGLPDVLNAYYTVYTDDLFYVEADENTPEPVMELIDMSTQSCDECKNGYYLGITVLEIVACPECGHQTDRYRLKPKLN